MPQLALEFPASGGTDAPLGNVWQTQLAETFRPIHYLGSKLRVVEAIASALDRVEDSGGAVLDLFSGSGTVAMALAGRRTVIANDVQEYSRVICSALLTNGSADTQLGSDFEQAFRAASAALAPCLRHATQPLIEHERDCIRKALSGTPEAICDLLEHGSVLAAERGYSTAQGKLRDAILETLFRLDRSGFLGSSDLTAVRYFGGAYFSFQQALELDLIACASAGFEGARRDLLAASLLSTASEVVNTVGKQFAQPIRPRSKAGQVKPHLVAKIVRDRALEPLPIFRRWLDRYSGRAGSGRRHEAFRGDFLETITHAKGRYAVVYADPPYTRDHYSRFYHVLETLALRDNPPIARSPGAEEGELSRGLYRENRHQSPFCIKSQASGAFDKLFGAVAASGAALVLSYSPYEKDSNARPRLMTVDAILSLANKWFREVKAESIEGVAHSKLNHSRLNFQIPPEAEVLILCKGAR